MATRARFSFSFSRTFVRHTAVHLAVIGSLVAGATAWIARSSAAPDGDNEIVQENRKPGTRSWKLDNLDVTLRERTHFKTIDRNKEDDADRGAIPFPDTTTAGLIEGYAGAQSVNRGGTINFHVSSKVARYDIHVYRMGWYAGDNATEVFNVTNLAGVQRAVPAPDANGMVAANWPVSYTLTTGAAWTSGMYLATVNPAGNGLPSGYIPFVVRNDASTAPFVYVSAMTTYQAYNDWGGKSLYEYNSPGGRAKKVSFDRPYKNVNGAGLFFDGDYYMLRFLEREGYNVTYATSADIELNPGLLNGRKAMLSSLHDEYWSKTMRDNLEAALATGKHAAFFSANNIYWQIRFESSADGRPARVMACYKDIALDPVQGPTSTVQFRQAPVNRPENSTLGSMYEGDFAYGNSVPWVVAGSGHWIYSGTGLRDGDQIPNLVGYEWDRVFANGATPAGVVALSNSVPGAGFSQQGTVYQRASGALVFNAGTIYWPWLLDNTSWGVDARVQTMTRNLLNAMISPTGPPSTTLPPTTTTTTTLPSGTIVKQFTFDDGTTQTWGQWFGGTVAHTATGQRSGTGALRVTAVASTATTSVNVTGLVPGTTYTLNGYAKQDVFGGINGTVQFYGNAGSTGAAITPTFVTTALDWRQFNATFTVPAATTIVAIGINGGSSSFNVDDVTITQPTGATTTTVAGTTTTTRPGATTTTLAGTTTTTRPGATTTTTLAGTTTTLAGTTTTLPTGNVVLSATFEDGTTQGWGTWFGGPVSNTATGARTGTRALRATAPSPSAAVAITTLTPGTQYTLRMYVKYDTAVPYNSGSVQFYTAAGVGVGTNIPLTYTPDANGWVLASAVFTPPANTGIIYIGIDGIGSAFTLDDVAVFGPGGTGTTTTVAATTTTLPAVTTTTVAGTTTTLAGTTTTTRPAVTTTLPVTTTTTLAGTTTTLPGTTTTRPPTTTTLPATTTTVAGGTILREWRFEAGSTDGWQGWYNGSVVSVATTNNRTGAGSLRATKNAVVALAASSLPAGTVLRLSGYLSSDSPPPFRGGAVQFYDANSTFLAASTDIIVAAGTGYVPFTATFTVPANAATIVLAINGGDVAFQMDDVTITR